MIPCVQPGNAVHKFLSWRETSTVRDGTFTAIHFRLQLLIKTSETYIVFN